MCERKRKREKVRKRDWVGKWERDWVGKWMNEREWDWILLFAQDKWHGDILSDLKRVTEEENIFFTGKELKFTNSNLI